MINCHLQTDAHVIFHATYFTRQRHFLGIENRSSCFELVRINLQLVSQLGFVGDGVATHKLFVASHAHAPFSQHRVQHRHTRMFDGMGSAHPNSTTFEVFVKGYHRQPTHGPFVVLRLVPQVGFHIDENFGIRPSMVGTDPRNMVPQQQKLFLWICKGRITTYRLHISANQNKHNKSHLCTPRASRIQSPAKAGIV
jgi:hypothetical protein